MCIVFTKENGIKSLVFLRFLFLAIASGPGPCARAAHAAAAVEHLKIVVQGGAIGGKIFE